jgi:hypothetical protein
MELEGSLPYSQQPDTGASKMAVLRDIAAKIA